MDSIKKEINEEEVKKIAQKIKEDGERNVVEDFIKNNFIEIPYKDKKYRVRLLLPKEKRELQALKTKKFTSLLMDKDVLLEIDMIKVYKERGIDIDKEIDSEIRKLESLERDARLKLGESQAKNGSETTIVTYETKLQNISMEKDLLNVRRFMFLELTLENQLTSYVAEVVTYLTLDVEENGIWRRLFNTFDEFENCPESKLLQEAGYLTMQIQTL